MIIKELNISINDPARITHVPFPCFYNNMNLCYFHAMATSYFNIIRPLREDKLNTPVDIQLILEMIDEKTQLALTAIQWKFQTLMEWKKADFPRDEYILRRMERMKLLTLKEEDLYVLDQEYAKDPDAPNLVECQNAENVIKANAFKPNTDTARTNKIVGPLTYLFCGDFYLIKRKGIWHLLYDNDHMIKNEIATTSTPIDFLQRIHGPHYHDFRIEQTIPCFDEPYISTLPAINVIDLHKSFEDQIKDSLKESLSNRTCKKSPCDHPVKITTVNTSPVILINRTVCKDIFKLDFNFFDKEYRIVSAIIYMHTAAHFYGIVPISSTEWMKAEDRDPIKASATRYDEAAFIRELNSKIVFQEEILAPAAQFLVCIDKSKIDDILYYTIPPPQEI